MLAINKIIDHGLTAETIITQTTAPATRDLTTHDAMTRVHDADAHARGALAGMIGMIEATISQVLTAPIAIIEATDTTARKASEAVAETNIETTTVALGTGSTTVRDITDVLTRKTQDTRSRLRNTTIPKGKLIYLTISEKNRASSIAALPAITLPVSSHLQSSLLLTTPNGKWRLPHASLDAHGHVDQEGRVTQVCTTALQDTIPGRHISISNFTGRYLIGKMTTVKTRAHRPRVVEAAVLTGVETLITSSGSPA